MCHFLLAEISQITSVPMARENPESSFSKPPSAALDQPESDYTLHALLAVISAANTGWTVLFLIQLN